MSISESNPKASDTSAVGSSSQLFNLHRAALEGQAGLLRRYLSSASESEVSSRIIEKDSDGRTPLHWAASGSNDDVLDALLAHGAAEGGAIDVKDESGWTALMIASSAGNVKAAKELLARGASPTASNLRGATALHYAASKGHADVGRVLLEAGAEINARSSTKEVPLHRAAALGYDAFIRMLLSPPPRADGKAHEKLRVNPADRFGNTPLHMALESAHGSTAVLLIEDAGVDRERTNLEGQVAEEIDGIGGQGQQKVRDYVNSVCGPRE